MRSAPSDLPLTLALMLAAMAAGLSIAQHRTDYSNLRGVLAQMALAVDAMGRQDVGIMVGCDPEWDSNPCQGPPTLPAAGGPIGGTGKGAAPRLSLR